MNCDSHFVKGHSHLVCQDYALHEKIGDLQFAIVSDGCSSSKDVDVGARILCHIAKDYLIHYHKIGLVESLERSGKLSELLSILEPAIIKKCLELKTALNMRSSAFDATLLIVLTYQGQTVVMGRGDGAIIFKYTDKIKYVRGEYESGAPFYLSYQFNSDRVSLYDTQFAGKFVRSYYTKKKSDTIFSLEEKDEGRYQTSFHYNSNYDSFTDEEDTTEEVKLESISVISDGLFSFFYNPLITGTSGPFDYNSIIPEYVDFKNASDNFLKRRMRKVESDLNKIGVFHDDDLAIGTIYLGQ